MSFIDDVIVETEEEERHDEVAEEVVKGWWKTIYM